MNREEELSQKEIAERLGISLRLLKRILSKP